MTELLEAASPERDDAATRVLREDARDVLLRFDKLMSDVDKHLAMVGSQRQKDDAIRARATIGASFVQVFNALTVRPNEKARGVILNQFGAKA